jgi:hypothetical protein
VIQECYLTVYFVVSPVQLDIKILKERMCDLFFLPESF